MVGSTDERLCQYAQGELNALDGVINYAERMIYDERQFQYTSLRRHAYGKTVVISTELMGEQEFRLSSTSLVITPNSCGYATPHSPVGRLCSFVRPGSEGESKIWGEWYVTEIRLFDRYGELLFEDNVRNFLKMKVLGDVIEGDIDNLASFVRKAHLQTGIVVKPVVTEDNKPADTIHTTQSNEIDDELDKLTFVDKVEEKPADTIQTTHFDVQDDEFEELNFDHDEDDDYPEVSNTSAASYYGLSEVFYVNRTVEQDQVIARSPLGAMFVEGVAGSGKTSAALGRTKMLCDFNVDNVSKEADFRNVLGEDAAYWGGQFAGQFSQESSVGFVRTGELIQYLKETCRRIDLPQLPVQEYRELQVRLREHRRITDPSASGKRWTGMSGDRTTTLDSTMKWLHAADQAIAKLLAEQLIEIVPSIEDLTQTYDLKVQSLVSRVLDKALAHFSQTLQDLTDELVTLRSGSGFQLDRIASRSYALVDDLKKTVLSKDVAWAIVSSHTYIGSGEADLAKQMVSANLALYTRAGVRLVWVDNDGLVDKSLAIVDRQGVALIWDASVPKLLTTGKVLVRDSHGRNFEGKPCSSEDLYLMILPESIGRVYYDKEGVLNRVSIDRGLGARNFPLLVERSIEEGTDASTVNSKEKKRSIGTNLSSLLKRRLMRPLLDIANLYANTLNINSEGYPDQKIAKQIGQQFEASKLTSADIDLLLCIHQIAGRGFKESPAVLAEPGFFQSVFIDEVQDFTEQQVFLMAQQARPEYRAVTVVGDLAQKLHYGSSIDIRACFPNQDLDYVKLSENLRQADSPGLALFSACFRHKIQRDGEIDAELVNRALAIGSELIRPRMRVCRSESILDERILQELSEIGPGLSAAVIFPNSIIASTVYQRLNSRLTERMIVTELSGHVDLSKRFVRHFTEIENAKGLEFDVVIMPMLEEYELNESLQQNRLYVGITRARGKLVLLSNKRILHPVLKGVINYYQELIGTPVNLTS